MNEYIGSVLFGAQKQSSNQINAVVTFVSDMLEDMELPVSTKQDVVNSIVYTLEQFHSKSNLKFSEALFVQIILGLDVYDNFTSASSVHISTSPVGEHGKTLFNLVVEDASDVRGAQYTDELVEHENTREASTDKSMELVRAIVSSIKNRGDYPSNDIEAALMYSKQYWEVND